MSDLVGNPEDRFSSVTAQLISFQWDLFQTNQMETFDAMLIRLCKEEILKVVMKYEGYRAALNRELDRRKSEKALEQNDSASLSKSDKDIDKSVTNSQNKECISQSKSKSEERLGQHDQGTWYENVQPGALQMYQQELLERQRAVEEQKQLEQQKQQLLQQHLFQGGAQALPGGAHSLQGGAQLPQGVNYAEYLHFLIQQQRQRDQQQQQLLQQQQQQQALQRQLQYLQYQHQQQQQQQANNSQQQQQYFMHQVPHSAAMTTQIMQQHGQQNPTTSHQQMASHPLLSQLQRLTSQQPLYVQQQLSNTHIATAQPVSSLQPNFQPASSSAFAASQVTANPASTGRYSASPQLSATHMGIQQTSGVVTGQQVTGAFAGQPPAVAGQQSAGVAGQPLSSAAGQQGGGDGGQNIVTNI